VSQDTHALSGAYALDALSPEEAGRFERHLEGCDPCRVEVREFREVAAQLGARAAETPPASLREKVLTHADRTRQEPPPGGTGSVEGARVTPLRRRWVGFLAAAAFVLVAGVAVLQPALDRDEEPAIPALAAPVAQVFEAEDVRAETVEVADGGVLRVAVSREQDRMAVDARALPDPGGDQVYQLWTGRDGRMTSAGVLDPEATGAAMAMPEAGVTLNVTIEPAGGSEQPTSTPIVTVEPADL
jgi:anti-sigma-K factor RskA